VVQNYDLDDPENLAQPIHRALQIDPRAHLHSRQDPNSDFPVLAADDELGGFSQCFAGENFHKVDLRGAYLHSQYRRVAEPERMAQAESR